MLIKGVHKLTKLGQADEVFNWDLHCMNNVMDNTEASAKR